MNRSGTDEKYGVGAIVLVIIIAVVAIAAIIINTIKNKDISVEYYVGVAHENAPQTLIIDKFTKMNSMISKYNLDDTIQNKKTFKKFQIREKYTQEFFEENMLAIVTCYEDNSTSYDYGIETVKYNKEKTEATVVYRYNVGTYSEPIANSHINFLIVEIPKSVGENVTFEKVSKDAK